MDNRFSTFHPNEDRFSFKASGTFRCDYHSGMLLEGLITPMAAMLVLTVWGMGYGWSERSGFGSIFTAACTFVVMLIIVVLWAAAIAYIRSGEEYSYYADEEKMTIKFPHDKKPQLVIRFDDEVRLFYSERKFMNKSQGINVRLECSKGEFLFRCKHNSATRSRGRQALPFYIIEERTGQAAKPDFYVR